MTTPAPGRWEAPDSLVGFWHRLLPDRCYARLSRRAEARRVRVLKNRGLPPR